MARHRQNAISLLTDPKVRRAFDVRHAPAKVLERYGNNAFGWSLLVAARLVEAGVNLVQVNLGNNETWDTHGNAFPHLKDHLFPPTDKALSALLDDLHDRGLLRRTLIVMAGEFGRTPKVFGLPQFYKLPGRDHWGAVQTVFFAGGGVRGGTVVGYVGQERRLPGQRSADAGEPGRDDLSGARPPRNHGLDRRSGSPAPHLPGRTDPRVDELRGESDMTTENAFAAIWDMDGTLVDTAELHFVAWREACRNQGRDFTRADFAATFGRRNPEIIHYLFGDRFDDQAMARIGDDKEEKYRAAARKGVELLPGVRGLLEGLSQAGFRQAIGSSAPRANLDLILERTGSAHFFGAVVGMEDTQRGKPDPQVFLVAADRLGREPKNSVVFEDAVAGVQAAKSGGMKCVAVRFVAHHSEEALRSAGADLIVPTLEQVSAAAVIEMLR